MSALKTHHHILLADLIRTNGAPAREIDGRMLRPLKTAGLVVESGGRVFPTAAAQGVPSIRSVAGQPSTTEPGEPGPLSDAGADALRAICREKEGVLAARVDGRVRRALKARGFIVEHEDWISATAAGREHFETQIRRRRRRTMSGFDSATAGPRAAVIHKHVEGLEGAVPPGVELIVGDMPCYADDILAALRNYARKLERGGSTLAG